MDIRVLGPMEVLVDGESIGLGGPRQRALLAMLVAAAPRLVPADVLIEGIWGEEPSSGARSTLQTHVSNLRHLLGDAVVHDRGGYRIDADPGSIDAVRFLETLEESRRLVATDPVGAAATLREALGWWRGRPYADLLDVPGLESEVRRLEELRLAAVELRIDAELAAGLHGTLVAELEALAEEHPLRERFRAQHMLALYRSGRQAEALRAYRRTESFLADELGVEPSRELQDLELKILDQDDSLLGGPGRAVTQRLAFLVTDIEGSTKLWDSHPQSMAAALATHDRVLREAVEEAGGRVFKHTGDGILAVFPEALSAMEAAEAAQRGLAAAEWGDVGPLRVRMGADVGEAETRGDDFFGPPLNRAARLCSIAHGGQVLVSSAAQTEIMAAAPPGLQVRNLGEVHLRGMASPERVSQLVFVGLPADFPDLRTDADSALDDRVQLVSLPGYEVRDRVGEGAFGVVWRAYQPSVGREVAVKVIRPELASQPSFVRRFEAEARTIARLAHPHIVPLIDFWRDTESAYLVLGMLPGGSLTQAIEQGGTVDRPAGRRILTQLGAALDHAHSQGMVHGDLKPANVLLDGAGNAYLSDFGIAARLLDPEVVSAVSSASSYRAPEEADTGPSPAADIYALGMLARELLDGTPEIEAVLSRATALNPEDRYQSAGVFLTELEETLGEEPMEVERPAVSRNPYKGLRAFDEADAADFHGRDELVATLLTAVSEHRYVTVVGPSGSGKSSAVQAGLVPALTRGALDGSDEWFTVVMTPGSDPLASLAEALEAVSTLPRTPDDLLASGIDVAVDGDLLVVIDQLEELYTLVDSAEQRHEFIDLLAAGVEDQESRVRVVATLRADFYHRPLQDERLGRMVRDGLVTVLPPTREELVEMITAPSQAVGLRWEPGLPHRIAEDVAHQPGGLPLLQYALTELVERRSGDLITSGDYTRIGGVAGALANRAEAVYQDLVPPRQEAARQVLLRLVTVDEDRDDIRRRVRRSELESLGIGRADLDAVLDRFVGERLLLADHDPNTRGPTVEVAHEALLREWPRLQGWVDDQREALILGRRFRAALTDWHNNGRHDDYLLTGTRLAPFTGWAETTSLTPEEHTYYQESKAKNQAQRLARRRRRRTLTGVLAAAAVVATTFGTIAVIQGNQAAVQRDRATAEAERATAAEALAEAEAERAAAEARIANSRRLAVESRAALADDPELAILLALEAAYLSRDEGEPLLPETISALHQAVQTSRLELRLEGEASRVAVSPDGSLLATTSQDLETGIPGGDVIIRDAATGDLLSTLVDEGRAAEVAFRPDGSLLAVGHWWYDEGEDTMRGHVGLWDPITGEEVGRLGHSAVRVAWSPEGELLATATAPVVVGRDAPVTLVTVWEVATGEEVLRVEQGGSGIAFLDEETLAVSDRNGERVVFHDVRSGEEVAILDVGGGPHALVFDPGRNLLVMGGHERAVEAWDVETLDRLWHVPVPDGQLLKVSPSAGLVASTGQDGQVRLHHPDDGSVIATLDGHSAMVYGVRFYPAGERLASVGLDGEIRIWDITPTGPSQLGSVDTFGHRVQYPFALSPDGESTAASLEGIFIHVDLTSGEPVAAVELPLDDPYFFPAPVSPDWRLWAAVEDSGEAWVRDLATGAPVTRLPDCTIPMGFSNDGSAVVLNGVSLCSPGEVPDGTELRSRVIEVDTGRELLDLRNRNVLGPWALFNPGGVFEPDRYLAFNNDVQSLEIHDLITGNLVASLEFEADVLLVLAFDPTGRYLAGGTQNGRGFVLDLTQVVEGTPAGEALIFDRLVDTGGVSGVALNAEGILATSAFGSLRLWDIHTREFLTELVVSIETPPFAAFGPEGDNLYYADRSYTGDLVLHKFPLDAEELIALAESRLTRGLTDDECQRYALGDTCPTLEELRGESAGS